MRGRKREIPKRKESKRKTKWKVEVEMREGDKEGR